MENQKDNYDWENDPEGRLDSCLDGIGDGGGNIFVGFFLGVPLILISIVIICKIFGIK